MYVFIITTHVPSSSCLKTTALGISIIGVMLPNTEVISLDVFVTVGN